MRFISPYSGYRFVAKHQQIEILASGQPRVLGPGFTAEFRQADVTDWEIEKAREAFSFRGAVTDQGGRPLDPVTRTSSWDSNMIRDPKLRKEVEDILLRSDSYGHDFIAVEEPVDEPPWPNYAKVRSAKAIAQQVEILGLDVMGVIRYEEAHDNREGVIAALLALEEEKEEEPLVTA